ncbi:hypothetical protein L228DRAFT_266539 [Xylona heveae TC161]|uniref:1-phosphatidylinositol-3-phosphate 5-kinase n=1 Tax=Xylona heveae (strain CBS 132557 / TC161) TaxID=1328760 RepID=A0A165I0D7_XYLHT|nr:hypothetical protein L228DRAFT_266539 [Xylona heveae TC161]KZF24180.1 hypothetical protein L228DRAFT_266539 [Xylona heveae TC161]
MSSKQSRDLPSPSPSASSFLPSISRRSRRSSLASVSSMSKGALSQALDHIHSSASQSETLTTFNEFASPPPAVTAAEGKSLTGDLVHGGISGLYSRFRASVSGGKEITGVYSAPPEHKAAKSSVVRESDAQSATQPSQRSSLPSRDSSQGLITSETNPATTSYLPPPTIKPLNAETGSISAISHPHVQNNKNLELPQASNHIHFDTLPLKGAGDSSRIPSNHSLPESSLPINDTAEERRNSDQGSISFGNTSSDGKKGKDVPLPQSREPQRTRKGSLQKEGLEPLDLSSIKISQPAQADTRTQARALGSDKASRADTSSGSNGPSKPELDHAPETDPFNHLVSSRKQESLSKQPLITPSAFSEHATTRGSPEPKYGENNQNSHRPSISNSAQAGALPEGSQPERKSSAASDVSRNHERPVLATRVSQSRLPGYRISRTSSSDAEESLPATTPLYERQVSLGDDYSAANQARQGYVSSKGPHFDPEPLNAVLPQPRSKVLSKEYWMRDENAKDCFCCGDTFSTFRRKHHCRTCGQIFDSKCTSLVSGRRFDYPGSVRVCKPCELIINGYDDSSDVSDDDTISSGSPFRQRQTLNITPDAVLANSTQADQAISKRAPPDQNHNITGTPVMAIPATRRARDASSRGSAVLEIDGPRPLSRPSSSRSLKASITGRPHSSSHKRHHSRYQHLRGFRSFAEDRAPFHRSVADEKPSILPAFHNDSIIDPDLAPYLSDEGSSPDEQISIFGALNSDMPVGSVGNERNGLGGFLAAVKKGRSKLGEKSLSGVSLGRDPDEASLGSSRVNGMIRSSRKRNLSTANLAHQRVFPMNKQNGASRALGLGDANGAESPTADDSVRGASRISTLTRSASMTGVDAPAVELNYASLQHVSKLLKQLLQDSGVPSVSRWERALLPILLQSTDDVNPDVSHGDDIDIRHYVKLKKVPGGRPGDTHYVSGVVFSKNLALKSMPRSIFNPRIVVVTFPIEYARHQQHFMSLEPVISQEREFLENLVNRIAALRPQLLLVQRNVSGLALQFLEEANIATAYNVKPSVIEAVARCTQARIISSIDKLAIQPAQLGTCEGFHLKTYVQANRKKTYMYFSGCSKDLGCTIVLRGADLGTLSKIKKVTEFMIYVVYNLKLETCLMRDEFVLIPSSTSEGSLTPSNNACLQQPADCKRPPSTKVEDLETKSYEYPVNQPSSTTPIATNAPQDGNPGRLPGTRPVSSNTELAGQPDSDELLMPDDVPMPTFYEDMIEKHKNTILSASPFVKFMQPYLLMRAREQERRLAYLKRLRDQDISEENVMDEKERSQKFDLIKPEMVHESVLGASRKVREVLRAVHDAEYDKALHSYKTQKRQWETYISGNRDLFDPFSHQSIVVLYSVVCTVTTVPCFGPELLALEFYNEHGNEFDFEADCTLGQYVEELCLGSDTVCMANGCERKMFDHHRQYVHGEAQVSVFVQHYPSKLRGMQDTILMWNCCRVCGTETQVIPMSESTWKYSFGKYLELAFWSSDLHPRAGVCPHDIHRDHLRFFGYKDVALRIQYDPINLLEIIVPRPRVIWKVENDLRIKNEQFEKTEDRIHRFMSSVKSRIKGIKLESVAPEKSEACKAEIERLTRKANEDHSQLIKNLQDKYMDSKYFEMIPLNRAVRAMQEKVAEWDAAFSDFDRNFFPSERDIRRLAALQLKKIFLDRDDSSVGTVEAGPDSSSTEIEMSEKPAHDTSIALSPQPAHMSPEETHDVLTSVVNEQAKTAQSVESDTQRQILPGNGSPGSGSNGTIQVDLQELSGKGVQHLDLAVPVEVSERASSSVQSASDEQQKNGHGSPVSGGTPEASPTQAPSALEPKISEKVEQMRKSALNTAQPVSQVQASGIPRLAQASARTGSGSASPPLYRMQSQPAHLHLESNRNGARTNAVSTTSLGSRAMPSPSSSADSSRQVSAESSKGGDKKFSERFGVHTIKPLKHTAGHSLIPRSIHHARKDSKVFTLAKHFEQLSREFEKERLRERRLRAAGSRQSRAYPITSSKPIVEVYRNVHEAVEEREPSDDDHSTHEPRRDSQDTMNATDNGLSQSPPPSTLSQSPADSTIAREITSDEVPERTEAVPDASQVGSEIEAEPEVSDLERSILDDIPEPTDESQIASPTESSLELPKHEKSSLMKMLTNFWAERSASGWAALDYPLIATDHVFADSDIIVREDEPSSLIAFALGSEDYMTKLRAIRERKDDSAAQEDEPRPASSTSEENDQIEVERSLLRSTGTHLKYQFQEGSAKMLCKIFYAEQFDALRRKCGVSDRIVESFSRCLKWDSKGGKTKSVFLKTLDDRFVLKSLSPIETQAFLKFAPAYFQIMSEALFHELPSVIAKMFGFYQVIIKNPNTGVEFNWYLLAMENLFYDRTPTRIFDLKGSMRNRYTRSTGERNEVLLDENMVEFIYESPLFAREHSKRLLRASVWNDTLFLARQNVMDYSLMIAIDENRKELVVGIIDCIRTYTWDKKLESWIKDRGKNKPTVTSPKEYKSRFREAMGRYVLQAPNCWHQFTRQTIERRPPSRVDGLPSDVHALVDNDGPDARL